jgi:hypothetical protein
LTSINQFPKAKLPAIIQQMLPGRKISGHEYIVRNPKRADKRVGSFKICVWGPKAGVWSDFAANVKGGDSISLVVYLTSLIAGHRHFAFPCTSARSSNPGASHLETYRLYQRRSYGRRGPEDPPGP